MILLDALEAIFSRKDQTAPTRVEFLFQVLLGAGALFRVVTPHSSVRSTPYNV